jgi:hypothetical protein
MADINITITFPEANQSFLKDAVDSDPEMKDHLEKSYIEKAKIIVESLLKRYLQERKDDLAIIALNSKFLQDKDAVRTTKIPSNVISVL